MGETLVDNEKTTENSKETIRSVYTICEKCQEKLYLQVDSEEMQQKMKGGIFKVEVPHAGHSTIFFLSITQDRIQIRGQVTGDSIVEAVIAPTKSQIPQDKVADIDKLTSNAIGMIPGVDCVFVLDNKGETIGIKHCAGLTRLKIDTFEIMIHQILEGMTRSFDLTTLGTGVFELGNTRFVVAKAGPTLSIVLISDIRIPTEQLLAYSLMVAEKLWRIMDGRRVTLDIPRLEIDDSDIVNPNPGQLTILGITPGSYLAKLAIVGDEAVGKSSLVRRFIDNAFSIDYKVTLGVNISTKTIQFPDTKTKLKLTIMDMGGQDQFFRVRKAYFRGTSACFVVFDVTNRQSFDHLKTWIEHIMEYAGSSTSLILIGNKSDLVNEIVVPNDEIANLIRELGCPYIETSAKTGDNVETAFTLISMSLCDRSEKLIPIEQVLTMEQFLNKETLPTEIIDAIGKTMSNIKSN